MDRYKASKTAGILGIVGNIFLLIIKGIIGFVTHSQSMIADSANSASDIFASLMTFIGGKIASKPNDDDHNMGHGKAEYIFSMFISISMIGISIKLLLDSFLSLFFGSNFTFSWMLVAVCIITIIVKFALYMYTKSLSKKYSSLLLLSNQKDHRNDCIATTFTLISALLSLANIFWFDSLVGVCISIWICYTGIGIFNESYNVLMDRALDENLKKDILSVIEKYPEIKKVNHLTSSPVGYKYLISVTIFVDGNMSTFESHEIADKLEKELNNLEFVHLSIIHVNPIEASIEEEKDSIEIKDELIDKNIK